MSTTKKCAVCESELTQTPYRNNIIFFCNSCYAEWKDDILAGKEWTKFLISEERKRRRRKNPVFIHLGDKWDVSTDRKLSRRE